jgi:predicted RNA-binding protein associated with RNAse of E/G family
VPYHGWFFHDIIKHNKQKEPLPMNTPTLYRRRFIPNELIPLKDDVILVMEKDLIITKWITLHPRNDIARGISAFYLDKGIKVSKIFDKQDQLVYWYCDIIQAKAGEENNTVIIEDLLIDVILDNDGSMRIMDLDELADALDQRLITQQEVTYALRTLHSLLNIISSNQFNLLQEPVNQAEQL